jgi:hypothetical protein
MNVHGGWCVNLNTHKNSSLNLVNLYTYMAALLAPLVYTERHPGERDEKRDGRNHGDDTYSRAGPAMEIIRTICLCRWGQFREGYPCRS